MVLFKSDQSKKISQMGLHDCMKKILGMRELSFYGVGNNFIVSFEVIPSGAQNKWFIGF